MPYTPTPAEDDLIRRAIALVRDDPKAFAATAAALDKDCAPRRVRRGGKPELPPASLRATFDRVWAETFPPPCEGADVTMPDARARRVILLVWLRFDHDRATAKRITAFQSLNSYPTEHGGCPVWVPDGTALDICLFHRVDNRLDDNALVWLRLLADALRVIQAGGKAATTGAPYNMTKLEKQAKAIMLRLQHPDWSDAQIARSVPWNAGYQSRDKAFQNAKKAVRESRINRPKGYIVVDPDTGAKTVEAVAPPARPVDDHSDRGEPIPRSRYFREYCADCGESMGVVKDKVWKNPVCDECKRRNR